MMHAVFAVELRIGGGARLGLGSGAEGIET
jgi:hypothetical protein